MTLIDEAVNMSKPTTFRDLPTELRQEILRLTHNPVAVAQYYRRAAQQKYKPYKEVIAWARKLQKALVSCKPRKEKNSPYCKDVDCKWCLVGKDVVYFRRVWMKETKKCLKKQDN
jgi:hypothetical protein